MRVIVVLVVDIVPTATAKESFVDVKVALIPLR
jgi:hypothetical protein